MSQSHTTLDEYIATFPASTQDVLQKIRSIIKQIAPQAAEAISYGIPAYKLGGKPLVYFGGYEHHVSLYPLPKGDPDLQKAMQSHIAGKGTVRFALDQPIPYDLIKRIVKQHLDERR